MRCRCTSDLSYTADMASRAISIPFAVSGEIRERLAKKAPAVLACGSNAAGCGSGRTELHFCCSAHKILNPSVEAPLSWQNFCDTLEHYEIHVSKQDAKEAYQDYLSEACMLDVSDEMATASASLAELSDASQDAEDAGDEELSMRLADKAYQKASEMMELASNAESRAKSLARSL